jgi:hypothetical protein
MLAQYKLGAAPSGHRTPKASKGVDMNLVSPFSLYDEVTRYHAIVSGFEILFPLYFHRSDSIH